MSAFNEDNVETFDEGTPPPEESNNRTFLLIAGGLGLLVLLGFVCLGGYLLFSRNSQQRAVATQQAQNLVQETVIAAGLTQTSQANALTQMAAATSTRPATSTPVIAQPTATLSPTPNPATATVGAAFTRIAVSTQTVIPTSTALPKTGFAEDVGLPGMFALAIGLVAVIFLVRRLRAAPMK
jgi:hypothetical protein